MWGYMICNGLNVKYDNSNMRWFRSFIASKLTTYSQFENTTYEQLKSNITTDGDIAVRSVIPRSLILRRTSPMDDNTVTYMSKLIKVQVICTGSTSNV
jgi:hypothetical protein